MLVKEFRILSFWGQNVVPAWVKNGEKGYFRISHLITIPVSPRNKVPNSHISNTISKLKGELKVDFWDHYEEGVLKGQKMIQNDKKFCLLHSISGTVHHIRGIC